MSRSVAPYGFAAVALLLAACSGGSSPSPTGPRPGGSPTPNPAATPVLQPGSVAQFSGSDVTAHVYASPTGTQTNYTAGYTFVAARTVSNAAAGAPAPYDLNTQTTYAVTQDPGQGVVRQHQTSDAYDTQVAASGGETVSNVATTTTAVGIDESAGANGGGPFTQSVATTTTYATPQTTGVYPLVTGATTIEPIGRTVVQTTTDANGGVSDTATVFTTSSRNTVASDGSYDEVENLSNGQTQTTVENPNGSATVNSTGPLFTLADTIGVPANAGGGFTIPVTTDRQNATTGATPAPVATTVASAAADWYPGNGLPATPFQTDTVTVRGPATTLPSGCAGAIAEPNIVEVDATETTLNVDASSATTHQQRFDSNGTPVCVLRTTTTMTYALTTGALVQTATETFAQVLTGLTPASSGAAATARHPAAM